MIFKGRLSDFREKRVCKQYNEGLNKFYIELIVFRYTQKITIIFDHSRLGLKNKLFLNKKTQLPTYTPPWYFVRLIGQPEIKFYAIGQIIGHHSPRRQSIYMLQFLGCISLSKGHQNKNKIRLEFFVFDKFTLQNLANKSGGV